MVDSQRRRFLRTVGSVGAFVGVGGAGTTAARNGRRVGASAERTIVELAADDGRFETLVAAVKAAGLVDTLDGNRQLTVFAPTDDGFANLGVTAGNVAAIDFESVVGTPLGAILAYHVTPGRRYVSSIRNAPQVRTLTGDTVTVDGTALNGGSGTPGGADVVVPDIEASNGVVHAINDVLLP